MMSSVNQDLINLNTVNRQINEVSLSLASFDGPVSFFDESSRGTMPYLAVKCNLAPSLLAVISKPYNNDLFTPGWTSAEPQARMDEERAGEVA